MRLKMPFSKVPNSFISSMAGCSRFELQSRCGSRRQLQRDAQPLAIAPLRAIGRAFRKVGKLARLDRFAVAIVLALALQAHADLIEVVLVARHIDLALLAHEIEPEIVERGVIAHEQRLELALGAANAVDLGTVSAWATFMGLAPDAGSLDIGQRRIGRSAKPGAGLISESASQGWSRAKLLS